MLLQPTFDPTNPASGQFNLNLTGGYGKAVLFNESNSNLKLTYSNNYTDYLPAWTAIEVCFIDIPLTNPLVVYSTLSVLQGIVASPISQIAIVTYEASEHVPGTYPAALVRSLSIGNSVSSTTSTNQVINDNNPAVMTVLEATQSGNLSGSNALISNDGSFLFAQFVSSVYTNLFQLLPGASPLLRLGSKLIFEAVDNAGSNLSNIFGVDSSGNTFLQSHKTGNQTVIYDKNGVAIAVFDANDMVNFPGVKQTVNGDTSGTMDVYEFLSGNIKLVALVQTNYRQAGAAQLVTLKKGFSVVGGILNFGNGGVVTATGGVVDTNRQITWGVGTTSSAGSQTNNTQIPSDAAGFTVAGFTQVGSAGGYVSAKGGLAIYAGI